MEQSTDQTNSILWNHRPATTVVTLAWQECRAASSWCHRPASSGTQPLGPISLRCHRPENLRTLWSADITAEESYCHREVKSGRCSLESKSILEQLYSLASNWRALPHARQSCLEMQDQIQLKSPVFRFFNTKGFFLTQILLLTVFFLST